MWLKLTGCLLVIAAGAAWGFSLAARYQSRPQQLRQLINGIVALKSYIRYAATPLAAAFTQSALGLSGAVRDLFAAIGNNLAQDSLLTPQLAIIQALAELSDELAFKRQEQEALILFGASLGQLNREEQDRYCDMLMHQLEKIELDAISLRDQNVAMYRYLGVCGGMTVAILLI